MTDESETQSTNVIRFPVVPKGTLEEEIPERVFNSDRARITMLEWAQRLEKERATQQRDSYECECEGGMLAWAVELMKVYESAFIDAVAELNIVMQDSTDEEYCDEE